MTTDFIFGGFSEGGIELTAGDIVRIRVEHNRIACPGEFEGKIQTLEIG